MIIVASNTKKKKKEKGRGREREREEEEEIIRTPKSKHISPCHNVDKQQLMTTPIKSFKFCI